MVISNEAARLTLHCDHGESASRTIDVQTRTDLNTIAKALRGPPRAGGRTPNSAEWRPAGSCSGTRTSGASRG